MIRTFFFAAAMVGLGLTSAAAQSALFFWDGRVVIDSVSKPCRDAGTAAGNVAPNDVYDSSYRARLDPEDPNQPNSGITFISGRSMFTLFNTPGQAGDTASDQMNGKGTYAMRLLRGNATSNPGPNQAPFSGKYVFKLKPKVVLPDSDDITIDGVVSDWRGVIGCTVRFRAAYRANPVNAIP